MKKEFEKLLKVNQITEMNLIGADEEMKDIPDDELRDKIAIINKVKSLYLKTVFCKKP